MKSSGRIQNQTIKKVTYDLDNMAYNTAVSSLMILTNAYSDLESISKNDYTLLLTLLNPIAPHITEELNENIGNNPIVSYSWPKYDENKIKDDIITVVVQVNGKIRGKAQVNSDISDEEMKVKAFEIENVKNFTEGKEIIKVIVIPKKIVNIVVK